MDDLYHQDTLDHYQHPDHYGVIDNADFILQETNASCGDSFTFYIFLDNQKSKIKNLTFTGSGCAISTAASSMLTGKLIGQPVSVLDELNLEFMQKLLKVEVGAARLKCLLLPAKALSKIPK